MLRTQETEQRGAGRHPQARMSWGEFSGVLKEASELQSRGLAKASASDVFQLDFLEYWIAQVAYLKGYEMAKAEMRRSKNQAKKAEKGCRNEEALLLTA